MSTIITEQCDETSYEAALNTLESKLKEPVSFLQAPVYGRVQVGNGKKVCYFVGRDGGEIVLAGLGVRYEAPGGLRYLYFPYGPVVTEVSADIFASFVTQAKKIARQLGCGFVRIDNEHFFASHASSTSPAVARMSSLQPRSEWLLDISGDQESIWMGLHKHARYNIRLAERAHSEHKVYAPADVPMEDFYSLMATTGNRDSFSIFDRSYYEAYLAAMTPEDGFVAMVYIDGQPAATALFVMHDAQMHYVFAGSSNDYRKIAPAYFLIWETIKIVRDRGCTLFNFGGVQDEVKKLHLQGVTSFKKRYGGYQLDHGLPADLVISHLRYLALRIYKSIR
ncbi:MAG: peptidoglycan bridge formation glycyltransferase FemA/FemB family protein [Candidatus Saccharimonadales bacterium]